MKSGGWVALTNYPHPRHSGVSAWGKLDGLVGGGWISGRSGYWVERAPEVQTFSPQGLEEVEYLGARRHAFILSLFIQSITTTCARWREGHWDLAQSTWEVYVFMCVWACVCGAAKAGVPVCRERIRSLECKTLLDPMATFEAKSPAHICPSWVMIQLVAPLECWPLMHLITQSARNISIHWQWGLS